MRTALTMTIWYVAAACAVAVGAADDETPPSKAGQRAAKRLEIMRGAIDDFQITSSEIEDKSLLKFSERPSLRYADQSREAGAGLKGVIDATLWRLGTTGRPKAIVTSRR